MTPIHELLARIRWDPEFGRGRFELAYEDRLQGRLVRVPFENIHLDVGQHFSFEITEQDGRCHTVPLHRVREVWRDGLRIWSRHSDEGQGAA